MIGRLLSMIPVAGWVAGAALLVIGAQALDHGRRAAKLGTANAELQAAVSREAQQASDAREGYTRERLVAVGATLRAERAEREVESALRRAAEVQDHADQERAAARRGRDAAVAAADRRLRDITAELSRASAAACAGAPGGDPAAAAEREAAAEAAGVLADMLGRAVAAARAAGDDADAQFDAVTSCAARYDAARAVRGAAIAGTP